MFTICEISKTVIKYFLERMGNLKVFKNFQQKYFTVIVWSTLQKIVGASLIMGTFTFS